MCELSDSLFIDIYSILVFSSIFFLAWVCELSDSLFSDIYCLLFNIYLVDRVTVLKVCSRHISA